MMAPIYRCNGCGAYLDLDETHHGSHMKDTESGAVECGYISKIKSEDVLNELRHLYESREKNWGIADEAQYAQFERSIEIAIRQACTCGGGGPHDGHTCPACMVWHWYKHPALTRTRHEINRT